MISVSTADGFGQRDTFRRRRFHERHELRRHERVRIGGFFLGFLSERADGRRGDHGEGNSQRERARNAKHDLGTRSAPKRSMRRDRHELTPSRPGAYAS